MAILDVNFISSSLKRTVPIRVILPVDKLIGEDHRPYKTLYLLNGLLGNYTDWVNGTRIQRWAEARNLAVVMPSGENSYYIDGPGMNHEYSEYVGKELVEITRKMFPLSTKREDTFIAGLSMGGYGAIRNGLKYHDTFGYIAGLSSALNIFEQDVTNPIHPLFNAHHVFGDLVAASKTDQNPRVLVAELKKENVELPKMYLCCGTEDALLQYNRGFAKFLKEENFNITYEEGPGSHEWDFWDTYIQHILEWLPLDEPTLGISSGNVKKGKQ